MCDLQELERELHEVEEGIHEINQEQIDDYDRAGHILDSLDTLLERKRELTNAIRRFKQE